MNRLAFAVPQDLELRIGARGSTRDHARQILGARDGCSVEARNHIARLDSCAIGRPARHDLGDERTLGAARSERFAERSVDRLNGHAEPTARDVPGADELAQHFFESIGGNGETDAAPIRVDGRVDADHFTLEVEERASAVAGVDRGVGLDEIVVGSRADGAIFRADDAHRHGVAEAEWVADGDDVFADAELLARSERGGGQVFGAL